MMQNTLFSSVPAGLSCRSVLKLIIAKFTVANIVAVMIASRENFALVANYMEQIVRLKKRDLEAAKHVDVPA